MTEPFGEIEEPGMYNDVDAEAYHAHHAIAKSDLDLVARSAAHWREEKENPSEPTPAMRFGSAVHCMVLEPDAYGDRYVIPPKSAGGTRTKKYAEWLAEVQADREGRGLPRVEAIADEDHLHACRIADAIQGHPVASRLVGYETRGVTETSVLWSRDVWLGQRLGTAPTLCKCRPDKLVPDMHVIVDLKTATNASKREFASSVVRYRYHVAAAWYLEGVNASLDLGIQYDEYVFVVCEKEPPYAIATYTLPQDLLAHARTLIEHDIHRLAEARARDNYPAYPERVVELEFGPWAYKFPEAA